MSPDIGTPEERLRQRYLRHNLTVNVVEGACYWIGVAFYSYQTVLPLFVSKFTTSPFALGVIAMAGNSGWLLPQLFTARWVQRTPWKKHIVVRIGFFSERLPIILLALVAWVLAATAPRWALAATLFLAVWGAYGAGLIAVAWQSLIAKIIPQQMRGRFIGVTSALGMAGSTLAAAGVTYILGRWPFPLNFALSFTAGAVFTVLSWAFIALTREWPDPVPAASEHVPWWRELWRILREDRRFARFIIARAMASAATMGVGFLAVYAVQRWKLGDEYAGVFNGVASAAQFGAYVLLGPLADRHGHKRVLEIGALVSGMAFLIAAFSPFPELIVLSFAGLGIMQAAYIVSSMMIVPEFAPPERLPFYFGIGSTVPGLVSMSAPILGATVASGWGYPTLFLISAGAGLAAWALYHYLVPDPRQVNMAV